MTVVQRGLWLLSAVPIGNGSRSGELVDNARKK